MDESILDTIKEMLGVEPSYSAFDTEIIADINTIFMFLNQIGIGPESTFRITGDDEEWSDFLGENANLEPVKTYIYLRVKTMFDPPASSTVLESIKQMISECEWRLYIHSDNT